VFLGGLDCILEGMVAPVAVYAVLELDDGEESDLAWKSLVKENLLREWSAHTFAAKTHGTWYHTCRAG
jgi:hypothetical protein